MVSKFFIDTNVIIHNIILTKLKQRREDIKKGTAKYERYEQAYNLIEKIIIILFSVNFIIPFFLKANFSKKYSKGNINKTVLLCVED